MVVLMVNENVNAVEDEWRSGLEIKLMHKKLKP